MPISFWEYCPWKFQLTDRLRLSGRSSAVYSYSAVARGVWCLPVPSEQLKEGVEYGKEFSPMKITFSEPVRSPQRRL